MTVTDVSAGWIARSAQNLAAFFHPIGRRTAKWADVWVCDCGLPEPIVNTAALLRPLDEAGPPELTERLDAFYAESGVPWILWSPWPTPDLAHLGYALAGQPPLMVRAAGAVVRALPQDLRIEEVRDAELLAVFDRALVAWYPLEHIDSEHGCRLVPTAALGTDGRFWIGFSGDQPVTVAAACVTAGVVGVYCVATAPEARGRGYGGAITDVVARCEPELPAVLQSSDMGYPVYQRLGFEPVARYSLWIKSGSG